MYIYSNLILPPIIFSPPPLLLRVLKSIALGILKCEKCRVVDMINYFCIEVRDETENLVRELIYYTASPYPPCSNYMKAIVVW